MMLKPEKATAIEKALQILLVFAPHNEDLGTAEVSRLLGFHKATASRILLTLAEHGFLQQDPATRRFSLGPSIHTLGLALMRSLDSDFVPIAKPYVDALRDEIDEAVGLERWSGTGTVWVYSAESSRPHAIAGQMGSRLPFNAGAGAKIILAYSSVATQEELLRRKLASLTPATITDPAELRRQLQECRARGFSIDRDEVEIGIGALGAPILDCDGQACAAVVVVAPTRRLPESPESPLVTALKRTAAAITARVACVRELPDTSPGS
jgi:IclR family acetate operon transcriptional repressor